MNGKKIRLAKYLAQKGICSRRSAEKLILNHKIKVNGSTILANNIGIKVDSSDVIEFNNQKINSLEVKKLYFLFNKPKNVICTNKDFKNRKKVIDYFKEFNTFLYPIGRLDYDSTGLIIVSNDGEFAYKLMHPKFEVVKTYQVLITKTISQSDINLMQKGIVLKNNVKTSPCQVKILKNNLKNNHCLVEIKIHEGKKHQVKNMFKFFNYFVLELKRTQIDCFKLNHIRIGSYQKISQKKINYFLQKIKK